MTKFWQSFQAILWDLDGVLVDTGDFHFKSWSMVLPKYGLPISYEIFQQIFGMNNKTAISTLLGREADENFWRQISDEKELAFRASLKGNVTLLPGIHTWLDGCHKDGILQAIASSAPMENITEIVDEAQIRGYFQTIVSGYGKPGKPDPWVFLEAARLVGIAPEHCLVVEDAIAGVQAAKNAGMRCLAVTTTNSRDPLFLAGADWVVDELTDK